MRYLAQIIASDGERFGWVESKCGGACQQCLMLAFLVREPYNLSLSLADDLLSIISKRNGHPRALKKTGFEF